MTSRISSWVADSGSSRCNEVMPISSISRILAPTYDCDPGSVPTSTVPRPGATPCSLSFETRFVRSSFICAAVARPSSFSAVIWWRRPLSIGIDLHPSPASGLCTQCNDQPAYCHRLHLNYDTTKTGLLPRWRDQARARVTSADGLPAFKPFIQREIIGKLLSASA